jgi:hypothetical protein
VLTAIYSSRQAPIAVIIYHLFFRFLSLIIKQIKDSLSIRVENCGNVKGNLQGKLLGSGKEFVEGPVVHPQVFGEN